MIYTQYELEEMHQIELAKRYRAVRCLEDPRAEFHTIKALGRRSRYVKLQVTLTEQAVTVYVRQDAITRTQLRNGLAIYFPRHTFHAPREVGSFWMVDADRWTEDQIDDAYIEQWNQECAAQDPDAICDTCADGTCGSCNTEKTK